MSSAARVQAFWTSSPNEQARAAAQLGFSPDLFYADRQMQTFSGGEKVKLQLGLLTLARPDCCLLDEPSNDLDIETLEWLERFIRESQAPVLFISHDEALLENTANVILHMEQLRRKTLPRHTVARMGYRQYVEERFQKFAHQEQLARKEREEDKKRQERLQRIQQKVQHQLDNIAYSDRDHVGKLLKKKMKAVKSMERRFDREREDMTEFPDSEEAILVGFPSDTAVPAGKTVADFTLPRLEVEGETLAQHIRLYVRGPEHLGIIGKKRGGEDHPAAADRRGAAAPEGSESRLHAPGLRGDRGPGAHPRGVPGQDLGKGGADPGADVPGQHEVHPPGAGPQDPGAVRGTEGQALLPQDNSGRGQCADSR